MRHAVQLENEVFQPVVEDAQWLYHLDISGEFTSVVKKGRVMSVEFNCGLRILRVVPYLSWTGSELLHYSFPDTQPQPPGSVISKTNLSLRMCVQIRWMEKHVVLSLTSVKEGDMVVLHRAKIHILPKIRLLWGVRCQKALSMESLLWEWGVKAQLRGTAGRDLNIYDKAPASAYLQQ